MLLWVSLFLLAAVCNAAQPAKKQFTQDEIKWMTGGKCRMKWRPEKLRGACTGLKLHTTFDEVKHIQVNNSVVCKALCCNLNEKCSSWQYELSKRECYLGGAVLYANEAAPVGIKTVGKCQEYVSNAWSGRMMMGRNNGRATCTWGERLPNKCEGMGKEVKHKNGTRLGSAGCEKACCESKECDLWQESPNHGCFFGLKASAKCELGFAGSVYEGGRKCIKGFCGGLENTLLNATVPLILSNFRRNRGDAGAKPEADTEAAPAAGGIISNAVNVVKNVVGVGATKEITGPQMKFKPKSKPMPDANGAAGANDNTAGTVRAGPMKMKPYPKNRPDATTSSAGTAAAPEKTTATSTFKPEVKKSDAKKEPVAATPVAPATATDGTEVKSTRGRKGKKSEGLRR